MSYTRKSIPFEEIKEHFEGKDFHVGLVADKWGKVHTLSVYRVPPGHPHFLHSGHMFSVAVLKDGHVRSEQLQEQVRRYVNGEPSLHPHTGRPDR